MNVAHLLPQGSLRREVMGDEQREATDDELAQMRELAVAEMQGGAWGMSYGLIYVPSHPPITLAKSTRRDTRGAANFRCRRR